MGAPGEQLIESVDWTAVEIQELIGQRDRARALAARLEAECAEGRCQGGAL